MARFCRRIIEQIQASNFLTLDFLVYRQQPVRPTVAQKTGIVPRIGQRLLNANLRKHALYDFYLKLDRRKKKSEHPRDVVDCTELLSNIDTITVEPIGKKFVHRFPPEAIEKIRAKNLDVLIRFGFNILKGDILNAARYGVWSFHHGDNDFYRGGPPHFWELYESNPISGVILQVLTEELDSGLVLCKSLFATGNTISVSQNSFSPYWGAADLMIRKLNELHRFGWDYLQQNSVSPAPYHGKRALYRTPSNWDMARWLAPIVVKKAVKRSFGKSGIPHWQIGVRLNATPLVSRTSDGDLRGFRWIDSPKGHFWADPFLVEQDGRKWIFFEDFLYAEERGIIACSELGPDGSLISPQACIDDPKHHYSYPYMFPDGNEWWMVPESYDSNSVDLYRCERFPDKWIRQTTLLRGKFVDPSIWRQDGLWWLMVSSADPDPRSSALFLFYAETLEGEWKFHPSNPVSTDVRANRGAGRIECVESRVIRPSQCCSPVYGYSFALREITALSPEKYEERLLREFTPEQLKMEATHTYNRIPGVEVIDAAQLRPRGSV